MQLVQTFDSFPNGLKVGQHTAQPAVVYEEHANAGRFLANRVDVYKRQAQEVHIRVFCKFQQGPVSFRRNLPCKKMCIRDSKDTEVFDLRNIL